MAAPEQTGERVGVVDMGVVNVPVAGFVFTIGVSRLGEEAGRDSVRG